ncbi:MAG TPA: hypothetical protein PKL92_08255 [Aquaticitalea sp.]|nr:hypothetical protein [Aquaticitalea sp.]
MRKITEISPFFLNRKLKFSTKRTPYQHNVYFCEVQTLKRILDFYINSSVHVALSVFSMSWVTLRKFQLPFDADLLCFVFFAAVTGYNFVKYFGLAKFHYRSLAGWLKAIQMFSFYCFVALCFFALRLPVKTLFFIAGFGVVTFLYAIPFLPKRFFMDQQKNLRDIGGLKVYVIGFVWAGVTVLLPLFHQGYPFHADVWLTFFQRFVFVIILMLPFEIRDLQYDSLRLSTIPQKIGVRNTKIMGVLWGMLFFFLEFFKDDLDPNEIIITLIIAVITLIFVVLAKKEQSKYYSAFWVEGIPLLWLMLGFGMSK